MMLNQFSVQQATKKILLCLTKKDTEITMQKLVNILLHISVTF